MQYSIEELRTAPVFKPFKLTIEVNTPEELANLYTRFNVNYSKVLENVHPAMPSGKAVEVYTLWDSLDDRCSAYVGRK